MTTQSHLGIDFDFARYINQRRGAEASAGHSGAAYAYPGDQRILRTLARVTPVTLATEATVRLWKNVAKSEILGTAVKVTERQFPEINRLAVHCARRLHIAVPTIYIAPEIGTLNAHTFGTNDDSYIVLNGALVDYLSEDELLFVIGHECGHIQNNHVVYHTALYYLMYSANLFVRWIIKPAVLALQSWARRAEITCDRAGLLCCEDVAVALSALVKLALGSKKLADQIDMDEYLKQLEESQQSVGRVAELLHSHPYLPKRAAALRLFAQTHYYRDGVGADDAGAGISLNACDAEVSRLVSVFSRRRPAPAAATGDATQGRPGSSESGSSGESGNSEDSGNSDESSSSNEPARDPAQGGSDAGHGEDGSDA